MNTPPMIEVRKVGDCPFRDAHGSIGGRCRISGASCKDDGPNRVPAGCPLRNGLVQVSLGANVLPLLIHLSDDDGNGDTMCGDGDGKGSTEEVDKVTCQACLREVVRLANKTAEMADGAASRLAVLSGGAR